jgi:hypothetical protein
VISVTQLFEDKRKLFSKQTAKNIAKNTAKVTGRAAKNTAKLGAGIGAIGGGSLYAIDKLYGSEASSRMASKLTE